MVSIVFRDHLVSYDNFRGGVGARHDFTCLIQYVDDKREIIFFLPLFQTNSGMDFISILRCCYFCTYSMHIDALSRDSFGVKN